MRGRHVAVVGASGFIGTAVVAALEGAGHTVRVVGRDARRLAERFPGREHRIVDLAVATTPDAWRSVVAGVDGVVSAAGTLTGPLDRVQAGAPSALFAAARNAGVPRLVHVSASGAAGHAPTAFLRTKADAEAALIADRPEGWTVVRASIVGGRGGTSFGALAALSRLPIRPRLPSGVLRPLHVQDLAIGLVRLIEADTPLPPVIDAVGPEPMTADGYIATIGAWLGPARTRTVGVPAPVLSAAAWLGPTVGARLLSRDALRMLADGADGDPDALARSTGVRPRPIGAALARDPATREDRIAAAVRLMRLPLRLSLAVLWLVTGALSLLPVGVPDARDLAASAGLTGPLDLLRVAGGVVDLLLGAALVSGRRTRRVASAQAIVLAAYTLVGSILLPELWLHPFGPLLKNLPLLAATILLAILEE